MTRKYKGCRIFIFYPEPYLKLITLKKPKKKALPKVEERAPVPCAACVPLAIFKYLLVVG